MRHLQRLFTMLCTLALTCPAMLACGDDGGGAAGSGSLGQLCTTEVTDGPSDECGGGYCVIEGCTPRCSVSCDPASNGCPDGFECSSWLVDHCFPSTACTDGGNECGAGFECVEYVQCDPSNTTPSLNSWRCVPAGAGITAP